MSQDTPINTIQHVPQMYRKIKPSIKSIKCLCKTRLDVFKRFIVLAEA